MGLNRFDVIKEINIYSSEDNKSGLIDLLCKILDDEEFKQNNLDLVHMIISIGELYGYYSYINYNQIEIDNSEKIRRNMYKSYDNKIYYNSGQLSLLNQIVMYNKVFISAPTTFGKTKLVLEYISKEYSKLNNILFIVPTNSLAEELYIKLLNFNHNIQSKYHITTNPKLDGIRNILILTPEKYMLLLESKNPSFDLYIMDESYKIEDNTEEYDKEDPLNSRSSKFRKVMEILAQKNKKVIYLSPYTYISDDSMSRFFDKYDIKKIDRKEKYVNKEYIKIEDSVDFKSNIRKDIKGYQKGLGGIDKATFIVPELKNSTIVYVRYPKDALDFIERINITFDINSISDRFKKFIKHIEENYEFEESKWYILEGLKKGIGIYVSPMPRYIKREIIDLFNNNELNILVVTSAFAEGVNSSAKNIVITNDIVGSNIKMTPLDLLNLSGRAGRFGIHSMGNIYSVKEEIHKRLIDSKDNGVKISNLNYENGKIGEIRNIYDIELIEDTYLNSNESCIKKLIEEEQKRMNLTNEDLNVALSISKSDKLRLYSYFSEIQKEEEFEYRQNIIKNIISSERKDVIDSITYIFGELKDSGIKIMGSSGDIPPYSKDGTFLWGKFYGIHSSGNIKEILKNRKKYIEKEYQKIKDSIYLKNSWIDGFITDGKVDNFKLYNQAFKFISNIIEYRIPFYIGLYVSIFKLYCKKNNELQTFDYDIIEISTSLENKTIEEKYNDLLEYGFSIDMIKKIRDGNDSNQLLDEYESMIYDDYLELMK